MAWAYVQTTEGVGIQAYEAVTAEIGPEPPQGAIFHLAGIYEGKLRVIEVWESEQDYRRFREQRLIPALSRVLGPEAASSAYPPPGLEGMEVHALLGGM